MGYFKRATGEISRADTASGTSFGICLEGGLPYGEILMIFWMFALRNKFDIKIKVLHEKQILLRRI